MKLRRPAKFDNYRFPWPLPYPESHCDRNCSSHQGAKDSIFVISSRAGKAAYCFGPFVRTRFVGTHFIAGGRFGST